jgi:hypothetical protein
MDVGPLHVALAEQPGRRRVPGSRRYCRRVLAVLRAAPVGALAPGVIGPGYGGPGRGRSGIGAHCALPLPAPLCGVQPESASAVPGGGAGFDDGAKPDHPMTLLLARDAAEAGQHTQHPEPDSGLDGANCAEPARSTISENPPSTVPARYVADARAGRGRTG